MWRLLVFVFVFSVNGQLIENQNGQAFTHIPFFNSRIVAQLKVQSIEGFYTYKNAETPFKPSLDWYRFRFNEKGQLIEQLEVVQNGKKKDSTLYQYAYYPNSKLAAYRYPAYGGAITEIYSYDSLLRLSQITYYQDQFKEELLSSSAAVLMREETLRYHQLQAQDYTQFNQYNLPFMDVSFLTDKDGYLIEKEQLYRMNQQSQKEKYRYSENGLLMEKTISQNDQLSASESWIYRYDQWGNLLEIVHSKNNQTLDETQIIYDYKTGYLGSIIQKDLKSNRLKILRFTKYTYFK